MPEGGLPIGWLVQLMQVWAGLRILPQGLGPTDWSVQQGLVIYILVPFGQSQSVLDIIL